MVATNRHTGRKWGRPAFCLGVQAPLSITGAFALIICDIVMAATSTLYVSSGREVAVAFTNAAVTTVHVSGDIVWDEAAFAGLPQPIVLTTNITLVGERSPATGYYPTVVAPAVRKIRLAHGVTLTFRRMLHYPCRKGNHVQAPGCDVFAPCLPGENGVVRVEDGVVPQRICYGAPVFETALCSSPRPPWVPGAQLFTLVLPQDGCDTAPSANIWTRCWARKTGYDDLAVFAADLEVDKPVLAGYALHFLRSNATCGDLLTEQCVQEKGTLGCYAWWLQQNPADGLEGFAIPPNGTVVKVLPSPEGSPPVGQGAEAAGPGAGGTTGYATGRGVGRDSNLLAGVLAGVLGGLAVVLATLAAAVLLVRRKRQRSAMSGEAKDQAERYPGRQEPGSGSRDTTAEARRARWPSEAPAMGVGSQGPAEVSTNAAAVTHNALAAQADVPLLSHRLVFSPTGPSLGQPTPSGVLQSAFPSDATLSSANLSAASTSATATATAGLVSAGSGWRRDVQRLDGRPDDVVRLTPVVLGKGAHGRVVVGEYRGARVAVKVLVAPGLMEGQQPAIPGAAAAGAAACGQGEPAAALDTGPQQQPEEDVDTATPATLDTGPQQQPEEDVDTATPATVLANLNVRRPSQQQLGATDGGGGGSCDRSASSDERLDALPVEGSGRDHDGGGNGGDEERGRGAGRKELSGGQDRARNGGSTAGAGADEVEEGALPEPPPAFVEMLRASQLGSGVLARRKRSTRSSMDWLSGPGAAAECALARALLPDMDQDGDRDRAAQEEVALCVTDVAHIAHTLESNVVASDKQALRQPAVGQDRVALPGAAAAETAAVEAVAADDKAVHTLAQEVEVLARCQHPNVVRLLAVCLTPPRTCLVMELMETSLDKMLYGGAGGSRGSSNGEGGGPRRPLLPLRSVLHIALDVAHGLAYLHPTIVHRDLKPANVLVNDPWGSRPVAKLSDFGLSRVRNTCYNTQDPEAGTPAYIAPEMFDPYNSTVTHHADMYAFGVLLWTMLSGEEPWAGLNPVTIAYSVAMLHHRLPWKAVPQDRCPRKLSRLVCQCWEADFQRRPAAAEVVKQLLIIMEQHEQGHPEGVRHPEGLAHAVQPLPPSPPQQQQQQQPPRQAAGSSAAVHAQEPLPAIVEEKSPQGSAQVTTVESV